MGETLKALLSMLSDHTKWKTCGESLWRHTNGTTIHETEEYDILTLNRYKYIVTGLVTAQFKGSAYRKIRTAIDKMQAEKLLCTELEGK